MSVIKKSDYFRNKQEFWEGKTIKYKQTCNSCDHVAQIEMRGYANNLEDIYLCEFHALQLVRKILEDLCELKGDRNG